MPPRDPINPCFFGAVRRFRVARADLGPGTALWMACVTTGLLLGAVGCSSRKESTWKQLVRYSRPTPSLRPQTLILGRSVRGRSIVCEIHGNGAERILLMATIHGDEAAGTPLLKHISRWLQQEPAMLHGRQVLLLPVVNPDGFATKQRHNARNVDLNRNFPAPNWSGRRAHGGEPLSEPESRAVHRLLQTHPPDRIVSLHEPLSCIDYDGPAESLARHMAGAGPLNVRKLGARPGSLGAYAGETLGIPTITLELPKNAARETPANLWKRYGEMLLSAITHRRADI